MYCLEHEAAADAPAVEALLDRAFGPQRHEKTCQRLRDDQRPAHELAFVVCHADDLIATIRFWDLEIGGTHRALLLGPLAVDEAHRAEGWGAKLVRYGLNQAALRGHRAVILVGDEPYYARFGFAAALTRGMILPGPVDRARFLGLELTAGALAGAQGLVLPGRPRLVPAVLAPHMGEDAQRVAA
ncbi:GNAT family N-acetyltransferase [Novispirillum sp. DQ9]|uniref:GNAT family N-acetyltransferase n=1 Tax=Novispirillum sp. DQ9 TaxID=3398612 RepID=UPI003C7ADED0